MLNVGLDETTNAEVVAVAERNEAVFAAIGRFQPAVWATPAPGTQASFVQLWFTGTHGDVGGSQDRPRALSDITLRWITQEATAAVGLAWLDGPPGGDGDPLSPFESGPVSRPDRRR